MEIGTVKWFNNAKGFGFINTEGFEGDIFAHFSVIESEGYRSLRMGQKVQFEFQQTEKGPTATRILAAVE